MPYYSNASQGTVRYSPSGFYDSGLLLDANSASVTNSATVVTAGTDIQIPIGKYDRVVGEYFIWYDTDADNDFRFCLDTTDSSGTAFNSNISYAVQAVVGGDALSSETATNAPSLSASCSGVTNGQGVELLLVDDGDEDHFARISFKIENQTATSGKIDLLFAQGTATGSTATLIYAGSHVMYKKY